MYKKSDTDCAKLLKTDILRGLTTAEARKRLAENGKNALAEKKKKSVVSRFFAQFNDFMIIILLAAAGVSFYVSLRQGDGDFLDPIIILFIVTVNAVLGLVQESKAERALEALKNISAPTARVVRDGEISVIAASEIVAGDLISLECGDFVPADLRLTKTEKLKCEEAALTGESAPSEKDAKAVSAKNLPIGDRKCMAYSGASVCYGSGAGIAVATGMDTEIGKIAELIMQDGDSQTPLQKKLEKTGKILGIGALIICFVIFLMGVTRHIPAFDMFITAISLAVAAIPEGLPAIVTIMLATGVKRMAAKGAIIRKLPAVETLGSATVICSDKTGTLTQNKMTVLELAGTDKDYLLQLAALCNDGIIKADGTSVGDPTETALLSAALSVGIRKSDLEKEYKRVHALPFDSSRKMMTTVHKHDSAYLSVTKGAPDILLTRCESYYDNGRVLQLNSKIRNDILKQNGDMANKALRVIAIAQKQPKSSRFDERELENGLTYVGLCAMADPPREEVKEAVLICKNAGIKPVMITGDHAATAAAIAKKLNLLGANDKVITGAELDRLSNKELSSKIEEYSVFARVSPEHKVRIVKAFKSRGHIAAMTGDGVNDAPALKIADIGCAMGISGTDVAKSAADMVLTDDNFTTIVEAVKEGRCINANIKKAVHFLLSSNVGEIVTIFTALLLGQNTPLAAIQLLWVNLVTDSFPAIALGVDPPQKDIMNSRPRVKNGKQESLFSGGLWGRIVLEGLMIGFLALLAYAIGAVFFKTEDNIIGRTMCFATLSISQLTHAFNMRSTHSIFKINLFENKHLVFAFIAGLILQVSVISVPVLSTIFKVAGLSAAQWGVVGLLCLMPVLVVELEKSVYHKYSA